MQKNRMNKTFLYPVLLAMLASFPLSALAAEDEAEAAPQPAWQSLSAKQRQDVLAFAEDYKSFMSRAKTELSFVTEAVQIVEKAGFAALAQNSKLKPGARFYDINRDRTITLMVMGTEPLTDGFRVVGAHIDSPRLELKGRPVYESEGFALFQTYRHGGIKNYQWVNLPLALVGHVDKKDGTRVSISIGLDPKDPVLLIPDLSPHVDQEFRERVNRDVISGEELDPIVASHPGEQSSASEAVLTYLQEQYDIEEADLVSAELALVPAMPPRDVGLDRSLMAIYGQDDKLSSYAAMRALMAQGKPQHTAIAYLVDNEEVGNVNNTGAASTYLVDLMEELVQRQRGDSYSNRDLRTTLRNTQVVIRCQPGCSSGVAASMGSGQRAALGLRR